MTKEKAIEEIEAIYKLAGLNGCFVVGSIAEKQNPQLRYIQFNEDSPASPLEIAAMCTATLSPLYQAVCLSLAIAGMSVSELTPRSWDQDASYRWYLDECLNRMATGTIADFYATHMKPDPDIPDVFKEYMERLLAPLKS